VDKTAINPWTWQDARGFTQAWRVRGADSVLFLAGQGPLDAQGHLVGEGEFDTQVRQTFDNLAVLLRQAEYTFADVVKVTVYLTDIAMLPRYGRIKAGYISGPQPASTALAVPALALPGMMIEVEAIATR
jgi:enamine deaminase RidA (YjgF/YER057c/UK114 family)